MWRGLSASVATFPHLFPWGILLVQRSMQGDRVGWVWSQEDALHPSLLPGATGW